VGEAEALGPRIPNFDGITEFPKLPEFLFGFFQSPPLIPLKSEKLDFKNAGGLPVCNDFAIGKKGSLSKYS
jgi:hypothetical protein